MNAPIRLIDEAIAAQVAHVKAVTEETADHIRLGQRAQQRLDLEKRELEDLRAAKAVLEAQQKRYEVEA